MENNEEKALSAGVFMDRLNIQFVLRGPDRAMAELPAEDEVMNLYGFVHGGALYTLADSTTWAAAHSDGRQYVTMSSSFHFIHSAMRGDTVRADAKVRHRGRSICVVEVELTGGQEQLLATGTFTFFCTNP